MVEQYDILRKQGVIDVLLELKSMARFSLHYRSLIRTYTPLAPNNWKQILTIQLNTILRILQ